MENTRVVFVVQKISTDGVLFGGDFNQFEYGF